MKPPSAELSELCGAVCDEVATPEQIARLEDLLAASAEARQFYLRTMQLSALLERYEPASEALPFPSPPIATRRFALPWMALAAGFTVLAVLYFAGRPSTGRAPASAIATLLDVHGAQLIAADGTSTPVRGGHRLLPGEILATDRRGGAVIRLQNEETHFILGADTRASLAFEPSAKIVHLAAGQISCDVAPQKTGTHWRIVTAAGEATVLGTQLAVSIGTEGTRVGVASGRVRVTARDTRESVETPGGYSVQLTPKTAVLSKLPLAAPTRLVSFTLVNADSIKPIGGFEQLADGAVLDLATLPTRRLNIRANGEPLIVGSVRFELSGVDAAGSRLELVLSVPNGFPNSIEIFYPYLLAGDPSSSGQPLSAYSNPWTPPPGRYTLSATPYAGVKGSGARGIPLTVRFEVVDSAARD
ncbi:MAG: FecR domain-containing protein [Verrucomicrobia bacterium]|nr:FecR domain-containing protein [Verrucomicrobiota bacterium]